MLRQVSQKSAVKKIEDIFNGPDLPCYGELLEFREQIISLRQELLRDVGEAKFQKELLKEKITKRQLAKMFEEILRSIKDTNHEIFKVNRRQTTLENVLAVQFGIDCEQEVSSLRVSAVKRRKKGK